VSRYVGRFAPSPTGPLHAGSLVAALASWLDARAHAGLWLVRLEDVDTTRCLPGVATLILNQLAACGLHSDLPPVYQSQRSALYQQALDTLVQGGLAYPCACTRQQIQATQQLMGQTPCRHAELIYPGTCRNGLPGGTARGIRFRTDIFITNVPVAHMDQALTATISVVDWHPHGDPVAAPASRPARLLRWTDRRLGAQQQDVEAQVGDFILKRADACFAYQLAVVVDDALQQVTDIVRGEDLADNTPRQMLLQRALGCPTPRYLHTPLVRAQNGEKLSKQNGARALDTANAQAAMQALNQAAAALGLSPHNGDRASALSAWVSQWRQAITHGF